MMTFYIIGVVISLFFLLSFFAWAFVNVDIVELDVLSAMLSTLLLSLFSWIFIFVVIMILGFEWAKKNREETK